MLLYLDPLPVGLSEENVRFIATSKWRVRI
jgi:hypothetical protein